MTGLALTAAVATELAILLAIAVAVLIARLRRQRRRTAELEAKLDHSKREPASYFAQIRDAMRIVIAAHRERFGGGAEVLHTGKLLRAPQAPDQIAMQLRYDFLCQEQRLLEDAAGRQDYWRRRGQAAAEFLRSLTTAEEGLRLWWSAEQRKQAEALDTQRKEHADAVKALNFKVQRRGVSLEQMKSRVEELEAYRLRFNMLHAEVLREREANEILRRRLREQAAGLVEQPLQEYQLSRESLDSYLDRGDISPFAARYGGRAGSRTPELRTRRQKLLLEGSGRRLQNKQQLLREALSQQRVVIDSLKHRLERAEEQAEQAAERELRLKTYYQAKVRELQLAFEESRRSAESMEKEINRSRRTSSKLLQQVERGQEEAAAAADLEQVIDRFSMQAIEMQQRIQALEQQLMQSNSENLALQARLETLQGQGAEAPSTTISDEKNSNERDKQA